MLELLFTIAKRPEAAYKRKQEMLVNSTFLRAHNDPYNERYKMTHATALDVDSRAKEHGVGGDQIQRGRKS